VFEENSHLGSLVKRALHSAKLDPEVHAYEQKKTVCLGIAEITLFTSL
jgi:hypothetical protein